MWCFRLRLSLRLTRMCVCSYNSNRKNHVDTIDEFTMHLMKIKSKKWEAFKFIDKENKELTNSTDCAKQKLENFQHKLINDEDVSEIRSLLRINYEENLLPVYECLDKIALLCGRTGDKETLDLAMKIAKKCYKERFESDANWEHYIAAIRWQKGDVKGALEKLELLYEEKKFLRRKLRSVVRCLLETIISDRGEVALFAAIETCKRLSVQYNEWYLLACAWQACFSSEWYSDQCISTKILEENPLIHEHFYHRLPLIIRSAIRNNQPELLHRLIELLLQYRNLHEKHIPVVVQALFKYKYRSNDFKSCMEILEWAEKENITLPTTLHQRILTKYLDCTDSTKIKTDDTSITIEKPNVKLKF